MRGVVVPVAAWLLLVSPVWGAPADGDVGSVCMFAPATGGLDRTTAANDDVPADIVMGATLYGGHPGALMIGATDPFAALRFDVDVAPLTTAGSMDWAYWNGAAWVVVAVEDGTADMHASGDVRFVATPGWTPRTLHMGDCATGPLYFVRQSTGDLYDSSALVGRITALP